MTSHATEGRVWLEYDYAVIRLVPRVDLGAFMNIGVVLHARRSGFLEARFRIDRAKVAMFAGDLDLEVLGCFTEAYRLVCIGGAPAGAIGALPPSERFHWLTAPRSAVLQTSPVHPGRSNDPGSALDRLLGAHCGGGEGA